ncbi:MAG: hypothetical protein EP334_08425 [Gammaproteobacteria bacterium]|nr:MAG: hypothetical protein EP334_08425 [Gammaproteobacteria bacterium]
MTTTAIFELNDSGLHCATDSAQTIVSPGYALLSDTGITTGQAALEKAYLDPRHSFNQYWRQLNLSPLPTNSKVARHHADLAYAQLLQLHRELGSPEQVIFATPGSFDREQLAILLGLAKASPFEAVGLVDAAVAAASQTGQQGALLHLDLQLHQAVITRLHAEGEVARHSVEVLPELGIKTFYDLWAQHIADQFIRQYRFDPLHTAIGEQQLYNNLPNWLSALSEQDEVGIELDSSQGRYRISLTRSQLLACSAPRNQQLQRRISELTQTGEALLASHRLALLPGLLEQLAPAQVLSPTSAIDGCLQHMALISTQGDLPFITRLPGHASSTTEETPNRTPRAQSHTHRPSHLLYRHRAYAIGQHLNIAVTVTGLQIDPQGDAAYSLVSASGTLRLQGNSAELRCTGNPDNLVTGDSILIGNERLDLIEVI